MGLFVAGLTTLLVVLCGTSALGLEVGPEADLCAAIDGLTAGEELALLPGDYKTTCKIRRGGEPGRPIVVRAADPDRRPRLVYTGRASNMLEIHASDLVIRSLDFWGSLGEVDGVRVISGHRIAIEDCRFSQLGGIAVASTHTSVRNLTVRRNMVVDSNATGMYFGCHDGITCAMTGLVVEGNFIRGVTAPNPQIGYGMEVKLNSGGVIRDNTILDIKGPGIMVYGSRDLATTSLIERNFVRGSRTSAGIVLGGGPAVVQNNISGWNFESGIALQNYGQRGLLRGILVAHNSVYGNGHGGITIPEQGPIQATIANNAVHARGGASALPRPRGGFRLFGNVECTWTPCFTNPEGLDFSPFPGSLLLGLAAVPVDQAVSDDFFGLRRRVPPAVGAVERAVGPIHMGVRP